MFCYNCGYQIPNESQFCSNCGCKLQNSNSFLTTEQKQGGILKQSSEYNRDALKQHLYDLRSLEFIKSKMENDISGLDYNINQLANPKYFGAYPKFDFNFSVTFGLLFFAAIALAAGVIIKSEAKWLFDFFDINPNVILILGIIIAVCIVIFDIILIVTDYSDYKNAIKNYKASTTSDAERVRNEQIKKSYLINLRENTYNEYCELLTLLDSAYSINIVPTQFRNLYAIYYLYEFISTSNESFSNALFQCNLDEIKQQLATVIENQREMIINQVIIMSQNDRIIAQNNQNIKHLIQVENNTALAATYSQIAAVNAEACAWIGLANYIS